MILCLLTYYLFLCFLTYYLFIILILFLFFQVFADSALCVSLFSEKYS